jgi:tetratricopeptide (TPR) repeat protein
MEDTMKCWSCGKTLDGLPNGLGGLREVGICTSCTGLMKLKEIGTSMEGSQSQSFFDAQVLFEKISERMAVSFENIHLNLRGILSVLEDIYKILRTPDQTKANEWCEIAEGLMDRGHLDESERFFRKSIDIYPLNCNAYVKLGIVYFRQKDFRRAIECWNSRNTRDIPWEYYKQLYRLIGMSYFYLGNYKEAESNLRFYIDEPSNYLVNYYYAQCCARIGDKNSCLVSLEKAVLQGPIPLGLIKGEENFNAFRGEIESLLKEIEMKVFISTHSRI